MITGDQLLAVFATYNQQVWPMQIIAYVLGMVAFLLAFRPTRAASRWIADFLAFFWLWVGLMFWLPSALQGFAPGYLFCVLFVIQSLLFLPHLLHATISIGAYSRPYTWVGIAMLLYALVGYPLVGMLIGHTYPRTPPFGLTPCPLIIFTFGLFLMTSRKLPKVLLVVPFCYALSGFLWISIGIYEDVGLVLSGLLGIVLIWRRDARMIPIQSIYLVYRSDKAGWSLDLPDQKTPRGADQP
jgi:hypothetical protein